MSKVPPLYLVSGEGSAEKFHERLIRGLRAIGDVSEDDAAAIRELPGTVRTLEPYEDIVREYDRPDVVTLIVDGFACRYKVLESGRRQILSFHIPGDIPDIQSLFLRTMDHSLGTLEPTTIAQIPHAAMSRLFKQAPEVGQLFWRYSLIEAAVFRAWMTNIGQREAYGRMAHLLCETLTRMKAVGLAQGQTCELPVTQAELGDAMGMSTVHINRSLQALRRDGLITFRGGSLTVLNWEGLQKAGEFDPLYLHLS